LEKIRALEKAKLLAVEKEDFDQAQKIKSIIDKIKEVSYHLLELEKRKTIAISS